MAMPLSSNLTTNYMETQRKIHKGTQVHRMQVHGIWLSIHWRQVGHTVQILAARHGDADVQSILDRDLKDEIRNTIIHEHLNLEA